MPGEFRLIDPAHRGVEVPVSVSAIAGWIRFIICCQLVALTRALKSAGFFPAGETVSLAAALPTGIFPAKHGDFAAAERPLFRERNACSDGGAGRDGNTRHHAVAWGLRTRMCRHEKIIAARGSV